MNKLTEFLVNSILNEDKIPGKTALFGGGFKPPTRGHLDVVLQGLKDNPEVDEVYVFVGSGVRNNISQSEAIKIWEMYIPFIPVKTTIVKSGSPLKDIKRFIEDTEDKPYVFIGARPNNDEDDKDVVERSKFFEKYGGIPKRVTTSDSNVSGTRARNAAKADNKSELFSYFPDALSDSQKDEIYDMLRSVVKENVPDVEDDGKAAPFGSGYKTLEELEDEEIGFWAKHADIFSVLKKFPNRYKELAQKLSGERKIALNYFWDNYFKDGEALLNENASYSKDIDIIEKCAELTNYMRDKGYNIDPLPSVEFVNGDSENARDFFGKTAYYQPDTQTIVLYTEGRHPKDIVRSYAHEMIHHIQNLEGRLDNINTTNTQEDDYLNDIEAEANLKGTMTFRNWTDSLNEIGDASAAKLEWRPSRIDVIAREIERKIRKQDEDTVEYYDMLPAIEVVSYESRTRYRVTVEASIDKPEDELAMTTLRVDFSTEDGGDQVTNKGEQYKLLATITDIIIQLINRVNEIDSTTLDLVKFYAKDDTEGKYANPDSKRGKLYQAFINKNLSKLPRNWKMSTSDEVIMLSPVVNESGQKIAKKNMDDYKKSNNPSGKVNDPFGLNAYAYELAKGLEEAILSEGRYDKFVNQLSRIAFETIKDGFESGRKVLDVTFTVRPEEDEPDIESDMFEFDFRVVADYTEDKYKVDGGANEGIDDDGNDITPLLIVNFGIPKKPKWSTVSMDLKDVVRHELEHLTQSGDNVVGVVRDPKRPELNRPGKQMADDKFIRDMIDADLLPKADYFKLEKEIDAMMQGLYFKAKKSKRPFKDVIDDYLNTQPISKEEKEVILNLWRSRRKALSLPVFENEEKVMKEGMEDLYTIYLDMDGVIVDFDRQFEEAFDMPPREFEEAFGTEMFWKKIEERGVGFWRGMKWMPGGQELYNRVAQHDHYLLSSPSKSNTSKIGKHMWKKDNTPNTKLILSRSYNKKNYADKSNILIDDRESNIQQWRDAGGIGILYKSAEQVNAELDKLGL
jgi:PAS domain-containing protein